MDDPDNVALDDVAASVRPGKALLWVDVTDATAEELDSLAELLAIHPNTLEDLRTGNQRTKLEHYGNHFHVAVHDCRLIDLQLVIREIDIVFGDGWLLTVRQPSNDPVDPAPADLAPVKRRFELERSGDDGVDEGLLLWALLDVIVDRYFVIVDRFDDRLDDAEEAVFADTSQHVAREVFDLRRSLVHFRRVAAPLREVLGELLRREADCLGPAAVERMRDVLDHSLRIADLVDSQRDLLTGLLEANLSVASNRMNQVMKNMTSWGAILLGASLIAGIYGMNFGNIPLLDRSYGYVVALLAMAALTITLYFWFKRREWL